MFELGEGPPSALRRSVSPETFSLTGARVMIGSAMQTALSGMQAASFAIQVTAHNVANSMTPGFQPSRVVFEEQTPQHGGASDSGNPVHVGRGVQVGDVIQDGSPPQRDANGEELSGVDLASELINLDRYSTLFRANLQVFQADSLLDELLSLPRRP